MSPLIALQRDQVAALLAPGFDAAVYCGDVSCGARPENPKSPADRANVGRLILMALCGVSFPRAFFPKPIQWLSACLLLTHGLDAIPELYGAARPGVMWGKPVL